MTSVRAVGQGLGRCVGVCVCVCVCGGGEGGGRGGILGCRQKTRGGRGVTVRSVVVGGNCLALASRELSGDCCQAQADPAVPLTPFQQLCC
jgi:hypothetical protein